MDRKEFLQKLDKQELIQRALIPYFVSQGWEVRDLHQEGDNTHGCNLLLKSVVLGELVLEGVHIELGKNISTQLDVRREVSSLADLALTFHHGKEGARLYKYFWITTGQISPGGHDALRQVLESHPNVGRVEAWDFDTLHDKLLSTDILDRRDSEFRAEGRPLKVFLSYASEDRVKVESISRKLKHDGFETWRDKDDILPGEDWEYAIRRAILRSDAVITFLSENSVDKQGMFQKETRLALSLRDEQPSGAIYLVPVKLDGVELDRSHPLNQLHWVQIQDPDDQEGYGRLLRSLRQRRQSLLTAGKL